MQAPRITPAIWLAVGAVVTLLLGTVLPPLIANATTLVPRNAEKSYTSAPAQAQHLDLAALRELNVPEENIHNAGCTDGEASDIRCYQRFGAVKLERHTSTSKTDEFTEVTVASDIAVSFGSERLLELHESVQLDRGTRLPLYEPSAEVTAVLPRLEETADSGPGMRDGVMHAFPPDTFRQSYPYFDVISNTSYPIDYVGETTVDGVDAFEFYQERSNLELPGKPLTYPASFFYSATEREERGLDATQDITLRPYYDVTRRVLVEPTSGIILSLAEDTHIYLAEDAEEAVHVTEPSNYRTVFHVAHQWDEHTMGQQRHAATPVIGLFWAVDAGAWLALTTGIILVIASIYQVVRVRRHHRAELLGG